MRSQRPLSELFGSALAATLLVVGLGTGCSSQNATAMACAGDVQCPPPSNNLPWAAQLSPNSSGSQTDPLMPQDQSLVSWNGDGTVQLQFRPVTQISGTVIDGLSLPVGGARVTARLASTIPGQNDYSFGTLTTDGSSQGDSAIGAWGLRVPVPQDPSNQPYRVWVGFDSTSRASLSPPLWRDVLVLSELGPTIGLSLQLRPQTDLAVVIGRIVSPLGDGIGDLTVQVLDAAGLVISSTATSDSAMTTAGSYKVYVDPTLNSVPASPLTVVVRPSPTDTTMPILESTLQSPRAGSETHIDFAVPSHRAPVLIGLPIHGTSVGTPVAVVGARVRAVVELSDAATMKLGNRAYYTASADSDSQGIASLQLVPAPVAGSNLIYQVSISSPSHLPFAGVPATEVQVGPNSGVLGAVSLPLRAEVRGQLLNADGSPAAGVTVMANLMTGGEIIADPLSSMLINTDLPQSTADVDGTFALRVDPGDYDFEFVPPSGTGARSSLDNQRIGSDDIDLSQIALPEVTLGTITLLSSLGAPVTDSKVRIFQLSDTTPHPGVSCVDNLPCSRNAKLRAEVVSDADGHSQVLLPGGSARQISP